MKRCTKELEQLKHLSLKINKVTSKNVTITRKKEKQYVRQIIYHLGAFTYKSCPRYWLYRWASGSMWCSSCEKYVCWWSQINDRDDKRWMQMTAHNLGCDCLMYCLGHIISFGYFYLLQNSLIIGLLTPRGQQFIKSFNAVVLHRLWIQGFET